jgi:bacillithiol system protein YtxJ
MTTVDATYLHSIEEWERAVREKPDRAELVLLKESPICAASFFAVRQFEKWRAELSADSRLVIYRVDVLDARDTSQHIAGDLGIRHESPQVIWLDPQGAVKWHASHGGITRDRLMEQLPV